MAHIDITKISSKGQVVIPIEMREGLNEGDKLVVIKNNDQIILKKADKFNSNLEEDLEFARRTEVAWKEYDQGKFVSIPVDEFLEELEKC